MGFPVSRFVTGFLETCPRIFLFLLFAIGPAFLNAAPSASDKRLLLQAEILFRKHGKFCVCEDCRNLKEILKARGLMAGRLGEKTGGKPLFQGPGLKTPRPVRPSPTPNQPRPGANVQSPSREYSVTQGRPIHPFRQVKFPPMAAFPPPVAIPPHVPLPSVSVAQPEDTAPKVAHGIRILDPRPRALAMAPVPASLPSTSILPPNGVPPAPPTFSPPTSPPSIARPSAPSGFPGRPVAVPSNTGGSGGLPGRPVASPGLPGRPIPSGVSPSGLPGRPVNPVSPAGLPGRPVNANNPPSNPQGGLQEKIRALLQQGVPAAAINMQTGIVRMNLNGQYLNESGRVIGVPRRR